MKPSNRYALTTLIFIFFVIITIIITIGISTKENFPDSIFSGNTLIFFIFGIFLSIIISLTSYLFLFQKEKTIRIQKTFEDLDEYYLQLYDNIENGILILDNKGILLDANPSATILLGYSKEELLKLNINQLLSPEQIQIYNKSVKYLLNRRNLADKIEIRIKDTSGANLILEFKISLIFKDHIFSKVLVIINDITSEKNLELSREYQNKFIEDSPMLAIQGFNPKGIIKHWNEAAENLYGYKKEEALGKSILDLLLSEESRQVFITIIDEICKNLTYTRPQEWEVIAKDNSLKCVYSYMFPIINEGKVEEIFCIDVDITRLKNAELALQKSEESYRSLFENSIDGIFRTTYDGKFLDANLALVKMLGYFNKEELLKVDIPSHLYFAPAEREKAYQLKTRGLNTYKLKTKDGGEIWVEETIRKLMNENNEIIFEGIVRDVTTRQLALEEKEKLYREIELQKDIFEYIVEFAPFGVLIIDAWTGEVYHHNIANNKIFGITDNSFYRSYNLWKDANLTDEMTGLYKHLRETGEVIYLPEYTWDPKTYTTDEELLKKIPRAATVRAIAYPMVDMTGKVTHFVIIEEDVTNQRNLEAQIRHAVKMESIGNLAGGIAHDFNNLLTGIIGNISLALSKLETHHLIYNYLINVEKAAKRAADLTSQLLSFSRKSKLSFKPINLNNCIDETIRILKRTIDPKIQIETKKESGIWPINADSGQIIQIIMNLCLNARDAIERSIRTGDQPNKVHKITIEADNLSITKEYCDTHFEGIPGNFVLLKITDTGCGMDKPVLEKIFEPFFTTKDEGEGTGLGLSIVYAIIKQHNGWINVYSEPNIGTSFKVYIPRILEVVENLDTSQVQPIRGGVETILIVDDEELVRDLGSAVLQEFGYKTIIANDGLEGVEIYKKFHDEIRLVLLDYAMPLMNGAEVLQEIKKIDPNQKIVLLSGYIVDSQAIASIKDSIDAFIQKPFQPNNLAQTVRDILDSVN